MGIGMLFKSTIKLLSCKRQSLPPPLPGGASGSHTREPLSSVWTKPFPFAAFGDFFSLWNSQTSFQRSYIPSGNEQSIILGCFTQLILLPVNYVLTV